MKPIYKNILFDLDGTLLESHPAMISGINYALEKMGYSPLADEDIKRFIGPPVRYSLTEYCGFNPEEVEAAVVHYRDYYREKGLVQCELFPGIRELLEELTAAGAKCSIATARPLSATADILHRLELDSLFTCVCGPGDEGATSSKRNIVARALSVSGGIHKDTVMIGDTRFDAEGASANGIDFIGVLYGYGSEEELVEHGASVFAQDILSLKKLLLKKK